MLNWSVLAIVQSVAANQYLTDHYHEAPVWIVACLEGDNPGYSSGASIYPAVENMLLAARALGLGSTLTTRHIGYAKECDEAMGIPPNYHSYAKPGMSRAPAAATSASSRE